MESVVPPLLRAIQDIRFSISAGRTMKEAFEIYLNSNNDALAADFRERWALKARAGADTCATFRTHYRRALWILIERGHAGQPVHEALLGLEEEIERAAQAELDQHLAVLPFKVMLPLLLFQFPAHLLLLLGPMLRELSLGLGGL